MKTYQKFSFFLIFLFMATLAKSQNLTLGGTINFGPSAVTSIEPRRDGTFKSKLAFSGNLGVFLEKKLNKNAYIGIEGLWVQMEGYEVFENIEFYAHYAESGYIEKIGFITEEYKFHTSYLGLPIYYRYKFGNFGIKVGFQTLIYLNTSTHFRSYGELNNEPFDSEGKWRPLRLSSIDFGPKIGVDYQLIPKLRLRVDYYHGIQNINDDGWEWIRKNRQLSLGVNYVFGKKREIQIVEKVAFL